MKVFITLAVVCLIASAFAHHELSDEEKAKIKAHYEKCVKQENVPEAEALKLKNKEFANATPAMKCFGACFLEEVGFLKGDAVQEDVVLAKLVPHYGEENVKKVLEKCKNEKGADRCETGYKIFECVEKAKAELSH
ncbi:general odorant-binding protein 56d-like [Lucilia cuprina]|uniref:general odorant-binding protein 56d-like n=1 Tax=Lucilia cuprina TaxID=7375 RepID=UPI001F05CE5F|nr:general odorant-binding protein 56d-like [Lucilia cuprina]